eukprot:TRINITY_DN24626_c0_g1_i6.p1 TRINITY_DN24626_c0_g1~~TRINITY_DN24626_c0_g1_i6.p1  ORF type:complete len:281 (-),score=58.49 TRINITY_DN24626_c0_g1_i6:325-1167(-)
MGASASASDEDGGLQDDVFPWFHMIQWCAEDADTGVFKWDLEGIQAAVKTLTTDADAFLAACPKELENSSSCPSVSVGEDTKLAYMEWAEALLEWNPELRRVRFKLVPSRMREVTFWSRYFAGVRRVVQKSVFPDEDQEQHAAPPVANGKKVQLQAESTACTAAAVADKAPTGMIIGKAMEADSSPEGSSPFSDSAKDRNKAVGSTSAGVEGGRATAAPVSSPFADDTPDGATATGQQAATLMGATASATQHFNLAADDDHDEESAPAEGRGQVDENPFS